MIQWVTDTLWGYDFFISYAHGDSSRDSQGRPANQYVRSLVAALRKNKYSVFHDESDYHPGEDLARSTSRRVRASSKLILIARPVAMTVTEARHWVYDEVRTAIKCGNEVIVVDINSSFANSSPDNPLRVLIGESRLRHDEQMEDLDGTPSDRLITRLVEGSRRVRTEIRRQRVLAIIGLVLAILAIAAGVLAMVAENARETAATNAERTSRSLFAAQMGSSETFVDANPTRAVAILDSPTACPLRYHEFTWRSLRRRASRLVFDTGVSKSDEGNPVTAGFRPSRAGRPHQLFVVSHDGFMSTWTLDEHGGGFAESRKLSEPSRGVMTFSRDTSVLAIASSGAPASITVQETDSGKTVFVIDGLEKNVSQMTFSRDGATLWAWTADHVLRAWQVPAGSELVHNRVENWPPMNDNEFRTSAVVSLRPCQTDSSLLACWLEFYDGERFSGYVDRFMSTASQPLRVAGDRMRHEELKDCAELEANRYLLVTKRIDSEFQTRLRLRAVDARGTAIDKTDPVADYSVLDVSPLCGVAAGTYQGSVRILNGKDLSTTSMLEQHRSSIQDVRFAADDRHLVTIDNETVCVWDVIGPDMPVLPLAPPDLQYSVDGKYVFFAGVVKMDDGDVDEFHAVWDRSSPKFANISPYALRNPGDTELVRQFSEKALIKERNVMHAVTLSKEQERALLELAAVSQGGSVAFVQQTTGGTSVSHLAIKPSDNNEFQTQQLTTPVTAIRWSPVEELLATADSSGTIRLMKRDFTIVDKFSIPDQSEINPPKITELCFSPDGTRLAILITTDSITDIRMAQVVNRRLKLTSLKRRGLALSFSPDSKSLVIGNHLGEVEIVNTRSLASAVQSREHFWPVSRIQFSHDGRTLMTAAGNDTNSEVFLRDPDTLQVFIPVSYHGAPARDAIFSPTRPELTFATTDGHVVVWKVAD